MSKGLEIGFLPSQSIVKRDLPEFFGHERYADREFYREQRNVHSSRGGVHDIDGVVLSVGTRGPWLYRQKFGEWAGVVVLVEHWANSWLSQILELSDAIQSIGYETRVKRFGSDPMTGKIRSMDPDERLDYLFADVEPRQGDLPKPYIELQT